MEEQPGQWGAHVGLSHTYDHGDCQVTVLEPGCCCSGCNMSVPRPTEEIGKYNLKNRGGHGGTHLLSSIWEAEARGHLLV